MRNKIKNPLLFVVALIPIAAVGGMFTIIYSFNLYEPSMQEAILSSVSSYASLVASSALQTVVIASICGFIGYIVSDKIGLMRRFTFEKKPLITAVAASIICGVLFSLDYWVFGKMLPQLADTYEAQTSLASFISSIFYGGVVEEVLMRLFLMSLIALILWKIFTRKNPKEEIPQIIFIAANILAAALFAVGHLPATKGLFGALTPLVVFRCFLLNGGLGLVFGRLYHRHGIQYAMLAHAGFHVVSKTIWLLFI